MGAGEGDAVSVDSVVTHVAAAVAVVTFLAYVVAQLFRRIGQPEVIGQLFAGIALGPNLLGRLSSDAPRTLFPAAAIPYLNVTSQVALINVARRPPGGEIVAATAGDAAGQHRCPARTRLRTAWRTDGDRDPR
jgi:hypothetical protein